MKKIFFFILLSSILQAQNAPFEYGYSAVGFSFSRSIQDTPLNSITVSRNTSSNYLVQATLNYVDYEDDIGGAGINSAIFGFSKMMFRDEDHMPFSGYTHVGGGFIKYRKVYYSVNTGFGLFHNFKYQDLSLVPEFFVNYTLLFRSSGHLILDSEKYLDSDNIFVLALNLNVIIKIMEKSTLVLCPSIQASNHDYYYRIKVGLAFGA